MRNLYTLVKKKHIVGIEGIKYKKDHLCGAYEDGKMTRAKHPSKTIMTTSQPFELLHMYLFGKEMDSEESASEEAEVESEEESDTGVASLALATTYIAKSIFNTEDNGSVTYADANDKDDSAPTYCFMARGAKVNSHDAYFQTSSEDDSDCESKPSYKTLAKIATEQQKAMEHIQKLLDRSDDLLDAEMTRSQSLIEDIKNLHVKYEELESRHEMLSTTHEKISYDYLQRKRELEKLRAVHEDLQKENESLHAQQISPAHEGFEPPCLKFLERDNTTSVAECSTTATVAISSTVDVVTNPSAEDATAIADENARLKTLLETGMYKSLKGHQTLCDVLKKQIPNRNPRKEGVGFKRKINVDGS
jgi:DNA repair exonuclease SbcCD ATPase subunit